MSNGLSIGTLASSRRTFSPASLANLSFWLDATDASTFSFSSGSVVSQWRDKSGNGLHFSQSTVSLQPSRNVTIGGNTAVKFDGADDYLAITSNPAGLMGSGARTFFVVVELTSNSTVQNVLYYGDMSNHNLWQMCMANFTSPFSFTLHTYASGTVTGVLPATGVGFIHGAQTDGSNNALFVNNNAYTFTQALNTTTSARKIAIGNADSAYGGSFYGWPFSGKIGEVIAYTANLSSTDRSTVNTYLAAKWGITL